MLIVINGFELETLGGGVFIKLGKFEMWLECSGFKTKGIFEVVRGELGTLHVFTLGRSLTVSKAGSGMGAVS